MDIKYNFFMFVDFVPMNIIKGVIYISKYGEDYVNIFRSTEQYEKTVEEINETDFNKNIFIDRGVYDSVISFRINNPDLPRDSRFIKTDLPVKTILKKLNEGDTFGFYDIFSGKQLGEMMSDDYLDARKHIRILFYVMLQYMIAGYHKGLNQRKIPDWCVCFSEPIMKYFIKYFEIETESPDITIVDQFLTTPQFREMITTQIMKVMANYAINNRIADIKNIESWYDIKTWIDLKRKF